MKRWKYDTLFFRDRPGYKRLNELVEGDVEPWEVFAIVQGKDGTWVVYLKCEKQEDEE